MKTRVFYLATFIVCVLGITLTAGAFWHDLVELDKVVSDKGRQAMGLRPGESVQSRIAEKLTRSR